MFETAAVVYHLVNTTPTTMTPQQHITNMHVVTYSSSPPFSSSHHSTSSTSSSYSTNTTTSCDISGGTTISAATVGIVSLLPHTNRKHIRSFFSYCLLLSLIIAFSCCPIYSSARPEYCRSARLPRSTFAAQPDPHSVYHRIDKIRDPAFVAAGLTKFATVFGVRIVASDYVADNKLLHTTRIMAKMLDNDEDGRPQNPTLVNTLYRRSATLGFVERDDQMTSVFEALPKEYACFLFLVLELESNIRIDGQPEPDCPHFSDSGGSQRGEVRGGVDRTIGLVGDFLIQSGYPTIYPTDSALGVLVESAFGRSKRSGWFVANQPPRSSSRSVSRRCDIDCQRVSFQSWALSSALGVDACSCRKFGAWKLCTPDEMRRADPELFSAILEEMKVPTGRYNSRAIIY
eukprot:GHVS01016793.1.p1 GENE.GHVS01016793.1~~GHVS01016793.1.p1  ORF type:complete len:402 (+),score=62.51 GHVS01016793.1:71-1276(+)